jgi:hypothetical protein
LAVLNMEAPAAEGSDPESLAAAAVPAVMLPLPYEL